MLCGMPELLTPVIVIGTPAWTRITSGMKLKRTISIVTACSPSGRRSAARSTGAVAQPPSASPTARIAPINRLLMASPPSQ